MADFRRRVRASQYDEEAHYGLGVAYFNLGLIEEAVDELTQSARLMPESPDIQVQLAVVLRRSFQAGNSTAETQMNSRLARTLLLNPDHIEANLLKAEILVDSQHYEEAMVTLERMIPLEPERARSKLIFVIKNVGNQRFEQQDWRGVEWCWKALEPLDPAAAKALVVRFLNQNSDHLPRTFRTNSPRTVSVGADIPKRVGRALLLAVAGIVVGFIQLLVVSQLVNTSDNTVSGWSILPFVASLLLFLASPLVAALWSWKTWNVTSSRSTGDSDIPQTKVKRSDLLAGTVANSITYQAAEAALERAIIFQQLAAKRS